MTRTFALIVCACAAVVAQAAPDRFEPARERIRDILTYQNLPSAAVGVAQDGEVLFAEGFGFADRERGVPATERVLYSLASISKPITATALMTLVERGLVDLDKPINDYLGEAKITAHVGDAADATVRRVLNHTAGLPLHYNFYYEDEAVARPDMDASIREYGHIVTIPGETWQYANFGYGLIEYVIERVSGRSYETFVREEVFLPLGMTRSAVNREPDFGAGVAVRYSSAGEPVPFYDFDHRGASAVFTSVLDLLRFGMFHLKSDAPEEAQILSHETIDAMHESVVPTGEEDAAYGLGLAVRKRNGITTLSHTGSMGGVATELYMIPSRKLVVVTLLNARGDRQGIREAMLEVVAPDLVAGENAYEIPPVLAGTWTGAISTRSAGAIPVTLSFDEAGEVRGSVGKAAGDSSTRGSRPTAAGDRFFEFELAEEAITTPETQRHPHYVRFKLKRRGDVLNGFATASPRALADRTGSGLSWWVELKKNP